MAARRTGGFCDLWPHTGRVFPSCTVAWRPPAQPQRSHQTRHTPNSPTSQTGLNRRVLVQRCSTSRRRTGCVGATCGQGHIWQTAPPESPNPEGLCSRCRVRLELPKLSQGRESPSAFLTAARPTARAAARPGASRAPSRLRTSSPLSAGPGPAPRAAGFVSAPPGWRGPRAPLPLSGDSQRLPAHPPAQIHFASA